MNNDDSNADADPHAIYSFWPLRDALVWKQSIPGVGRRYASSGHHDHDITKEQHLHRPPPPGVRMSHYCCSHRGESHQRRDRIPYTYTFLVVQRSACGPQLFKSLCSAGINFRNLSIRTRSNNLAYISLGDNGEQEGAADSIPSISLGKALSLVLSWSSKEQNITWTLLNMGFCLNVEVEKNNSSSGGGGASSSSSSSNSSSRSKTNVEYYLASPEHQEACVSTFATITGRVITRPALVPPQGLQPGQPVNAHGGGPGIPLGGLGHGYPMPPPPWAPDDEPDDDAHHSKSKVQEEPPPLPYQIVMVAACLNFSLAEITHIHRIVSSFPPRMLAYLPYLLTCRIQHTHRFSPSNYHRLALAIIHSELLVSPRLSPDITLLVSCPQTCSFRSLVRPPSTITGPPPCDGQHLLTIHSMVLRNIPWLEDQASESQAQRVFQRPTEAGPASTPSLQIDCQPFALETCEFLIHYARYGSAPLEQLSLGTMGPTSVGSIIHLATHWDVLPVLNVCEHFITSCLAKEVSTFSVLQLFDFLTQQGLPTGWELCLDYLVTNFERCCQEVAPDVQHLGYGITTRRKGLDEFVASPIAIAFINSRRLQCFPRQPRLTTDNLGLLVFRNVVQDVEEIKSKPLPGVDIFFACFDRRCDTRVSDRMLPRPVYARLWGPVLMGTAWEGQELFIRLQCSREYPIQQPRVEVVPPIFHPIIDHEGCVFPDAISAPGGAREASQILPTIRVVLERLTEPGVGPLGQPLANLQHSVNPEAVRVLMEQGLAAYVLEAQQRQAMAVTQMAQQVEAWYGRLGDRLVPEEKSMVEQALKTGQQLLYALKCLEHYNNEEAVVAMEAENA